MRMLAMNSLMHDADRRRADRTTRVVDSPMASSDTDKDDDALDDDVDELDPVDGFPSPPARVRPRRRFIKPGQTTYELSFSRRRTRRAAASPKDEENEAQDRDEYRPALPGASRPVPAVSSLSSVLTEVMTGKTQALNNIVDTTPPQPNVTYVVEHAPDGTPYVAASDGNKYFENSTIGQIFLKQAPKNAGPKGRRSDLDFLQSGGWNHQQQSRRSDFVGADAATSARVEAGEQAADIDAKKGSKSLLGFKGFHMGKKKKGSASDLKAVHEQGTAVLGTHESTTHQNIDNEFPMLDPDTVDRNRADSSWEVPAAKSHIQQVPEVQQPVAVRLLDSNGMQCAQQARTDLLASEATSDSIASGSSSLSSLSGASSTSSNGATGAPTKTLPRLQPKKDLPAPPLAFDAYDEDDNPLCRSFQNVRDVDKIHSKSDDEEDDEDHEHDEHDDAAAADEDFPDVNHPGFAGRVRVSSGATSVAEFVGGFKGQLSRRSGASGLVNRKRAARHARLTVEEQKAADLARKIREARNRIPLEFRDEYMPLAAQNELQKKKRRRAHGRHVRFNTDVLVREFEVESEEEDDGYNSPDEIVDAVQLVSKRDVVHAEDVVAAFPMEQLELPAEELQTVAHGFPSPPAIDDAAAASENVQDDPLTFSQLNNDKRMSFSDL
ncbi:hypothetical protein F441_16610 [Phytophthora nicotianae CJ01A1]|uniref:Uncharacterized protein n=3 Tax=Phytophthora nicotianae TaxID=4792 RepID=V9EDJ4_PHYNI|nr:hypothetical protein F443_16774 [Phytophthora nicotianae P1569]ETK77426.1 hypothetical protein L915_16306 [Phytophthora nicotianae]ETL84105.1 hypothetical protein L917_16012 [Phytophthora nicotianae]ETM37285.1 hypothetical protein L914_16132 [Phytophthora nicotianae]ETP07047.1 hypothetical protein F441_16610 [Phytophthora nicotianae CJ01A1]